MSETLNKILDSTDGMAVYEYIVNNVGECQAEMDLLTERLRQVDTSGQFLASTARFLAAVDRPTFEPWLTRLIEGAIERDRERKYLGSLLEAIWGADYKEKADELRLSDDVFRRLYKRMFPTGPFN